jgi:hypothetical protein
MISDELSDRNFRAENYEVGLHSNNQQSMDSQSSRQPCSSEQLCLPFGEVGIARPPPTGFNLAIRFNRCHLLQVSHHGDRATRLSSSHQRCSSRGAV